MITQLETSNILSPNDSVVRPVQDKYSARTSIDSYTVISYGYQYGIGLAEGFYSLITRIFLMDFPRRDQALKVLDLGCGVGRFVYDLADVYPHAHFTAIDYSQAMIDRAGEMLIQGATIHIKRPTRKFELKGKTLTNVTLRQGDAQKLPFPDQSFDCVNATNLLDRVPDAAIVLSEMMRVLKPNGTLILSSPLNFDGFEPSTLYTVEELREILLQQGLVITQTIDDVPYLEYKDERSISHWNCLVIWGIKKKDPTLTYCPSTQVDLKFQAQVFKEVFESAPWNEKWSIERAEGRIGELQNLPAASGEVLLIYNEVVGFWHGYPFSNHDHFTQITPIISGMQNGYGNNPGLFYLAEFGIRPKWQNRGLGKHLFERLTGSYTAVVTRTINPRMVQLLNSIFQNVEIIPSTIVDLEHPDRKWYLCRNPYTAIS